jgi:hypothetical protein
MTSIGLVGSNERSRLLSPEEMRAIMAAYPSREFGIMLEFACETAMRRSEICALDWSNIDLGTRVAHLPDTKNNSARDVPLSKRPVERLASLPSRTGPVFSVRPDSFTQAFCRGRKRARVQYLANCAAEGRTPNVSFLVNVRLHDGRHEATSRLFEKGRNVIEAASITGHRDPRMLKRYTQLRASDLAKRLDAPASAGGEGPPPRPADVLRRHLPAHKAIDEVAAWLDIRAGMLRGLLAGRARIDVALAVKLERLGRMRRCGSTGNPPTIYGCCGTRRSQKQRDPFFASSRTKLEVHRNVVCATAAAG